METTNTALATIEYRTFSELFERYALDVQDLDCPSLTDDDQPILLGTDGALLDGYHRTAGYLAALAAGDVDGEDDVRVVVVHNAGVAALIAEPSGVQNEAVALAYAVAGV